MKNYILILVFIFSGIIYSQDSWHQTNGPAFGGANSFCALSNGTVIANSGSGVGYYRSSDNGNTWSKILTLPMKSATYLLSADPAGKYVFASTDKGFFRSSDNGASWDSLSSTTFNTIGFSSQGKMYIYGTSGSNYVSYTSDDFGTTLISSAIKPPAVNYVSGISINAKGDLFISSSGIYRSTDGGSNWVKTIYGLPPSNNVLAIRIKPDGTLFASTNGAGVYRSTDNGNLWSAVNYMLWDFNISSIELRGGDTIYVGTQTEGMFRSEDNGNTWIQTGTELKNNIVQAISFTASGDILAGTREDLFRSSNKGTSWTVSSKGFANATVESIAASSNGDIYCSVEGRGLFRTTDKGENWTKIYDSLKTSITGYLSFSLSGTMFKTIRSVLYKSDNNGYNWTQILNASGIEFGKDSTIYAYGQSLNISKDYGKTWTSLFSPGIDTAFTSLKVNSITNTFIAVIRVVFGKYVSYYLTRSTDGGVNWSNCANGINLAYGLELKSVNSKGHIFLISGSNYNVLYRSTDNGDSWIQSGPQFPGIVRSLVIDSKDRLFAVTSASGIYLSTDNGDTWTTVNNGLFSTSTTALVISPDGYSYCGTMYNGIFRISSSTVNINDRITPLRNYNLFQNYPNPFNPNTTISYCLPERGNVKLTIYNSLGQVISELVNEEKPAGNFSVQFNAANLPSGVYLYTLKSGGFVETKKLAVVK